VLHPGGVDTDPLELLQGGRQDAAVRPQPLALARGKIFESRLAHNAKSSFSISGRRQEDH
jgi:hypothetical protein